MVQVDLVSLGFIQSSPRGCLVFLAVRMCGFSQMSIAKASDGSVICLGDLDFVFPVPVKKRRICPLVEGGLSFSSLSRFRLHCQSVARDLQEGQLCCALYVPLFKGGVRLVVLVNRVAPVCCIRLVIGHYNIW